MEQIMKRNAQVMKMLDLNQDGYLSMEDYEIAADKYAKMHPSLEQAKTKMYLKALKNQFAFLGLGEGKKITISEAAELAAKNIDNPEFVDLTKSLFSAVFDNLDVDNNGYLTHKEWRALMEAMKFSDPSKANEIFQAMDLNKDGQLSREEFVEMSFEYWYTGKNKHGGSHMFGDQ